ncbi:MFS transporter [Photobacterium minamisatsumaniensis]|uniref:MFS transporter n=1 Tax=Photobacterium minamisatsumaniensis TaxID=2910233 RepID=UPI003D0C6FC3
MKKFISIGSGELDTYLDYTIFSIISIYVFSATPFEVGILGSCFAIPFFLLSKTFGKAFDIGNVPKIRAILFIVSGGLMLALPFSESMVYLYIILIAKISCRCGINVSNPKLNKNEEESQNFYEISGYIVNVSRIGIPLLVTFFYSSMGLWSVVILSLLLNLIGFVYSIIDNEQYNFDADNSKQSENIARFSLRKEMKAKPELSLLILAYTLSNLSFFLSNDMLSIFFESIGESAESVGYIITTLGVGGIIGTKISSVLMGKVSSNHVFLLSLIVNSVVFSAFGFLDETQVNAFVYYFLIFLTGLASGVIFVSFRFGIRRLVDFGNLAKVTGGIQKISSVIAICMPILGGYLANIFSITFTFKVTGIALFLVLILCSIKIVNLHSSRRVNA